MSSKSFLVLRFSAQTPYEFLIIPIRATSCAYLISLLLASFWMQNLNSIFRYFKPLASLTSSVVYL
jgi:hypothetical protein